MGFWVFMIVADMVMPLLMVIMGRVFVKHPPKTINNVYGYRTVLSRKNQQTWDYAHCRSKSGEILSWAGYWVSGYACSVPY